MCAERCSVIGFRFAGVYIGVHCVCADWFTVAGTSTACDTSPIACSGDPDRMCGGTSATTAYEIYNSTWQTGFGKATLL